MRGRMLAMTLALLAGGAVGCSSTTTATHPGAPVSVVASTNVWADIVRQIGGGHVSITAFITNPAADPHSYEASTRNQLAISQADLIVENGGGYDDFMNRMTSAVGTDPSDVLNVVDLSGLRAPDGQDLNEHVWYNVSVVARFAHVLAMRLAALDPHDAGDFRANAAAFAGRIAKLQARERAVKAVDGGDSVAITEPVPLYLLQGCGLVNRTPAAFSKSVEDGTDVSVSVLADTLALFSGKRVRALVYNEQTSDPETQQILTAARENGIAVVPVTETLPTGMTYLSWMNANLDHLQAALAG